MLLRFSCNNYLSFNERTCFSLYNTNDHLFADRLHVAALYGRPLSGKSNWVKALLFMSNMVLHSHRYENLIPETLLPFLLSANGLYAGSYFEVELLLSETHYRYGFEVQHSGVSAEWLYVAGAGSQPQPVFTRTGQRITWLAAANRVKYQPVSEGTRPTWLLLGNLFRHTFAPAMAISRFFSNSLFIMAVNHQTDQTDWDTAKKLLTVPAYKHLVLRWLQKTDATVAGIALARASGGEKAGTAELEEQQTPVFNRNAIRILKASDSETQPETEFIVVKRRKPDELPQANNFVYFNAAFEESTTMKSIVNYGFLMAHALLKGATVVMDSPEKVWGAAFTRYLTALFLNSQRFASDKQFIFTTSVLNLPGVSYQYLYKNNKGETQIAMKNPHIP